MGIGGVGGHMGWEAIAEGGKITFCPQERCTVEVCCSSACWGVSCHTDAPPSAAFVELGGRVGWEMPGCDASLHAALEWQLLGMQRNGWSLVKVAMGSNL